MREQERKHTAGTTQICNIEKRTLHHLHSSVGSDLWTSTVRQSGAHFFWLVEKMKKQLQWKWSSSSAPQSNLRCRTWFVRPSHQSEEPKQASKSRRDSEIFRGCKKKLRHQVVSFWIEASFRGKWIWGGLRLLCVGFWRNHFSFAHKWANWDKILRLVCLFLMLKYCSWIN